MNVMTGRRMVAAVTCVLALCATGCNLDWAQYGYGANHSGSSANTGVTAANVVSLSPTWTAPVHSGVQSSPVVAAGTAYVGSIEGVLYAYDADGSSGCVGAAPTTCFPRWTAVVSTTAGSPGSNPGAVYGAPAVADGVVYITAYDGRVRAYDAAGTTNCTGTTTKTCTPLWTSTPIAIMEAAPTVADGVVYAATTSGALAAFDAKGTTGCTGSPKVCTPLWTASTGGFSLSTSSPTVAGSVVYLGTRFQKVFAFDARGITGCTGSPKTCTPLWTAATSSVVRGTPAVVDGRLYVGTGAAVEVFDATGTTGCSGSPKTCTAQWTAPLPAGSTSSPAVADGRVFIGDNAGSLNAFDATGTTGCTGTPKTCLPLWTGATGTDLTSTPSVAGGLVFVGTHDGKVAAFDAAGTAGCSGTPTTCTAQWTSPATGGPITASVAISGATVIAGSSDGKIYGYLASAPAG